MEPTGELKRVWIDDGCVEIGLDEAGRGSLWGPLVVGAVVMSPEDEAYFDHGASVLREIADSKTLTRRKRAILADFIRENAIETAVAFAEPEEIDRDNILQADLSAMHRALDSLVVPFQRILVDGDQWRPYHRKSTGEEVPGLLIIEGDAKSLSIAAASIIAKEAHDQWIRNEVERRPELQERYGLGTNMGYGTAVHMAGLTRWGADQYHRRSFAPVRRVIQSVGGGKPMFSS